MKSLFCTCALLTCSTLAHAQSIHWTFSYTGFYDQEAALFLPDARIEGSFAGTDANGDGVLERNELSALLVGTTDYVACTRQDAYSYCGADRFRFAPGAGLSFNLGQYGRDPEGFSGGGYLVTTGEMSYEYRYDPYASVERHLHWTDGTVLTMVSGVPEVPAWGMLVVRLVGMWAAGRSGAHGVRTLRLRRRQQLRGQSPRFNAARAT